MKKKRLLAIFAAFAVAATMAIGVTACGDNDNNDDGTHTEQPGDNNPENPNPENPEQPGAEDSGVTKEEWIKAWQDTVALNSYTMEYDGWTSMVSTDEVGNKYYIKMLYDNVNKTTYMQYADSNEESELYAEVVGSNILQYINSNGEWLSSTLPASNWENGNQLLSYASTVYTVAETTVSGTLAELYDYVKYDASSKTYSVNAAIKDNIVTLKVQLSDGYLYKLFISLEVDGETYEDKITFTGYNFTVVTVPQEVKDAVADNGGDTNPDEEAAGEAVTEEQWVTIWEEAKNFNHEGTIKGTQISRDINAEVDIKITYFADHYGYLYKALFVTTKEEQESSVEENGDIYWQFTETDIIMYVCDNDGIWYSQTLSFESYNMLIQCAYPGILYVPLRKTEDGENVYFSDCYDIAIFNDTTKEYEMQTWIKIGTSDVDPIFAPVDIRIKIVNGHLSELTITISNYSFGDNHSIPEMIISYKFGVEVDIGEYEVPEEVLAN